MKKVWNEQLVPWIFGSGRFTCPDFGYPLCNNISIIIFVSVSHRLQLHVDITHTHSHTQNIDTTACKGIQYHQTQNPCPDICTAVTNFLGFLVQIWVVRHLGYSGQGTTCTSKISKFWVHLHKNLMRSHIYKHPR